MSETNWAGTYAYRARTIHRPSTFDELHDVVTNAPRIRVLGSRHSFNDIADTDELVRLDALPVEVKIDRDEGTVSLSGAMTYSALALALDAHGLALANLASLPHISVAGAVATATHGSGDGNGNLATSVRAVELLTSDGELRTFRRGDDDRFDGVVVGLGALGAVTGLTLDVRPAYDVSQRVFEGLPWSTLFDRFDEITAAGDSVSVFTTWRDEELVAWVKTVAPTAVREDLFGARPAAGPRHPIPGSDPVHCTPQLGEPGRWFERLPHFRMGFTPSSGSEIQSEYLFPRGRALDALGRLRELGPALAPVTQVAEIRTIARDSLWMSPQYERDTVGVHFTWVDTPDVLPVVERLEDALAPFDVRPHWGKVFSFDAATIARQYRRLPDFLDLARELDPRGAFRNPWFDRHLAAP